MTPRDDGNFDVDPNEPITLTVTKSMPTYAAALLLGGVALVPISNSSLQKKYSFTAPGVPSSKVILAMDFDFQSAPDGSFDDGDHYTLQFVGKASDPPVRPKQIDPPPAFGETLIFFVRGAR